MSQRTTTMLPHCQYNWIEGCYLEEGRRSFLVAMASLSPCQDSLFVSTLKSWAFERSNLPRVQFTSSIEEGLEVEHGGRAKLRIVRLARQCGNSGAQGGGKARLKDQVNLIPFQGGQTGFETRAAASSTHFRVLWGRKSLYVWIIGGWLRQRLIGHWISCLEYKQGVWKNQFSRPWLESLLLRSLTINMHRLEIHAHPFPLHKASFSQRCFI